jgi:hypothetical protein
MSDLIVSALALCIYARQGATSSFNSWNTHTAPMTEVMGCTLIAASCCVALLALPGILKKVEKAERRGVIAAELQKFEPPRPDLYVPTNPTCRVVSHIPTSGMPMQSAAKVRRCEMVKWATGGGMCLWLPSVMLGVFTRVAAFIIIIIIIIIVIVILHTCSTG